MTAPLVSVVIPCFNRREELARALRSVVQQSFADFEVVVADDASQDDLASVVREIGDPRVRVVRRAVNGGIGAARNTGVAAAWGRYLAFLDSDDEWLPHCLVTQIEALEAQRTPVVAVTTGFYMDYSSGRREERRPVQHDDFVARIVRGVDLSAGSTMMIRADAWREVGPWSEEIRRYEDYDWFLRFGRQYDLVVVPEVCCRVYADDRHGLDVDVSRASATWLLARHGSWLADRDPALLRALQATLAQEVAWAAWRSHRWIPFAGHVGRALALDPRSRAIKLAGSVSSRLSTAVRPDRRVVRGLPPARVAPASPPPQPLRHDLVIATRNRPDDLGRCLASVAAQTCVPDTVRIVDSSDGPESRAIANAYGNGHGPLAGRVRYRRALPSSSQQRNIGVDDSEADVVHFLDDDVVLEPGYFAGLLDVFAGDGDGLIGGAGGVVTNLPRHRWSLGKALFLLDARRPGRVLASGRNVLAYPEQVDRETDVDWLSGCSMSFRRSVIAAARFDGAMAGYALGEDVDASFRVRQSARLVVTPAARLEHLESSHGRMDAAAWTRLEIVHRYRRVRNGTGHLRRCAFWWSVAGQAAGYAVSALARRSPEEWRRCTATLSAAVECLRRPPGSPPTAAGGPAVRAPGQRAGRSMASKSAV